MSENSEYQHKLDLKDKLDAGVMTWGILIAGIVLCFIVAKMSACDIGMAERMGQKLNECEQRLDECRERGR